MLFLWYCPVTIATPQDAEQQYNEHNYLEAQRLFEADMTATWNDPTFAYCYALTLDALDKPQDAAKVCEKIT